MLILEQYQCTLRYEFITQFPDMCLRLIISPSFSSTCLLASLKIPKKSFHPRKRRNFVKALGDGAASQHPILKTTYFRLGTLKARALATQRETNVKLEGPSWFWACQVRISRHFKLVARFRALNMRAAWAFIKTSAEVFRFSKTRALRWNLV